MPLYNLSGQASLLTTGCPRCKLGYSHSNGLPLLDNLHPDRFTLIISSQLNGEIPDMTDTMCVEKETGVLQMDIWFLFHASTFHNEIFYLLVLDVYITARNKIIIIMEERRDGETR